MKFTRMPFSEVYNICAPVTAHNQGVKLLATLWKLLQWTLDAAPDRSPWLTLCHEPMPPRHRMAPAIPHGLAGRHPSELARADDHSRRHKADRH